MTERPSAVFDEVDRLTRAGDYRGALRLLRGDPRARERAAESRERVALIRARVRADGLLAPARAWRASRGARVPRPGRLLIVDATTRCNQDCVYCFERGLRGTRPDMTFAEVEATVARAAAEGFTRVNFIGGEITLVPWLPAAVRLIRAAGMSAGIVTNGVMLSSRRAVAELADAGLDWVEVSFLSIDPAADERTGRLARGLALRAKALENLRALRSGGGPALGFNLVLTELNAPSLAGTLRYLLGFAPDLVMLKGVFLTDGADPSVAPRWSSLREPLAAAMRALDAAGTPFLFEDVPLCFVPPEYRLNQPDTGETGGVGFAYGGVGPDFASFRGREPLVLPECRACGLGGACKGPQSRYVRHHGPAEFLRV